MPNYPANETEPAEGIRTYGARALRINTGVHLHAERDSAQAECGATDGVLVECDRADYEARGICGFCIDGRNVSAAKGQ